MVHYSVYIRIEDDKVLPQFPYKEIIERRKSMRYGGNGPCLAGAQKSLARLVIQ